MIRVVIESPYAADTPEGVEQNIAYARRAMADALHRGEAPYASHLLYTQPGILDDKIADERKLGIAAGFEWRFAAELTAVYVDRGITKGMWQGIKHSHDNLVSIAFRSLEEGTAAVDAAVREFSHRLNHGTL